MTVPGKTMNREDAYGDHAIAGIRTYEYGDFASDIDLTAVGCRPRLIFVESAGVGTVILTDADDDASGTTTGTVYHSLQDRSYVEPSPLTYGSILTTQSIGDASAYVVEDVGTGFTTDTTDFNDVGTADVLMMPAAEAAGDRGLIGYTSPWNAVTLTLSTAGVGGTMTWKYYTGDPITYATGSWTALSKVHESVAGAKNLLASGTVWWSVPTNWEPAVINSLGPYYWVAFELAGTYSTNPVGSQGQLLNKTSLNRIHVGY